MMIYKINPSVNYNQWLKRFDNQLKEPTNQSLIKVPKSLIQRIRKRYYKTLGTTVINSPMSTSYPPNHITSLENIPTYIYASYTKII